MYSSPKPRLRMADIGCRVCFVFIAIALLPTVSSYCFKQYIKKGPGVFKCNTKVNNFPGGNLAYCCSLEGSVGFSKNKRGQKCVICEDELPLEDLPPVWSEWSDWSVCTRTCDEGIRLRTRICERGECKGRINENEPCIIVQECPIDGNWAKWSAWTSCSKTCSEGIRSRTRRCDDPVPMYGGQTCLQVGGDAIEEGKCVEVKNCPVDGMWGQWRAFSACSETCGDDAVRTRQRECDSPSAQFGGKPCSGEAEETKNCGLGPCPIDGQWSNWGRWSGCSKTCGDGTNVRTRRCNNPKPQYNGQSCTGDPREKKTCHSGIECIGVAYWSSWSDWSPCSECLLYKRQQRNRQCVIPKGATAYNCKGFSVEYHKCTSSMDCMAPDDDSDKFSGSGSGNICIGENCCDDVDGCSSGSVSFSSSEVDMTVGPLPTKCLPAKDDDSISDVISSKDDDSVSVISSSNDNTNGDERKEKFIWIDCSINVATPSPPTIDCDSSSGDCIYRILNPPEVEEDSVSDYDVESVPDSDSGGKVGGNNIKSEDYGPSLKEDRSSSSSNGGGNNNGGGGGGNNNGGGGGGGGGNSFSSSGST
ncbi:properdin-like [Anneissia japonica]|uniref:properdin-like n=1 Tax=Anneissia japonica TaxID=1529436 RepID=UPI0014254B9A|nr:properdin-like [Anneissia japonica]